MSIDSDPVNVPEASKKRKSDRTPEERAAKKARKEARKASKATEPSTAPANNPDNDAVEAYLKDNEISFDPADALAEFAPILDFASLEIDDRLRAGLTTFSKPTPGWSFPFELPALNFAQSKHALGAYCSKVETLLASQRLGRPSCCFPTQR
jgi:hypothetical protein